MMNSFGRNIKIKFSFNIVFAACRGVNSSHIDILK